MNAPKPCTVYRVHDLALGLVYVGIADDFEHRWRQHLRQSWWLGEVVVDRVEVTVFCCRDCARQVEAAVIHDQQPRYNTSSEEWAYDRFLRVEAHNTDRALCGLDEDGWSSVRMPIGNGVKHGADGTIEWWMPPMPPDADELESHNLCLAGARR